MNVTYAVGSNISTWAANFEGNADSKESDSDPLRDDLDPHGGLAQPEEIFSLTFDCHITPVREEHGVINGGKDHDTLEDHSWDCHWEDGGFFFLSILWLSISFSIFSNDDVSKRLAIIINRL